MVKKLQENQFGEFDSCEEINELAENLFNEGDIDSIWKVAAENGIPEDFVEMYIEGDISVLCDPLMAALGKLEIECEELKPKEIMADWVEYIKAQCMEHEDIARAVRCKGRYLKGCIASLLSWSFKNQQTISSDIIKAADVKGAGKVTLGIPGMGRAKKIIREYYIGGTRR